MKLLFIPTYFGGISWWRFEVPAEALRAAGHEVNCITADQMENYIHTFGSWANWVAHEMPKYDLIHTGYSPEANFAISLFKARDVFNVPIVTDLDDDIDNVPIYNGGWNAYRPGSPGQRIAKTQLSHSDGITFSTEPLSQAMSYLTKDKPSAVLGNWIDVDSWDHPTPSSRSEDKSIRLMVTGGNGRYGDWQILKEPLEWAMTHYDGKEGRPLLRLFFIGATPDWVEKWMLDKQTPENNRAFYIQPTAKVSLFNKIVRYVSPDIILSPTQTNIFNRSKSGLKFLEAAMAGAAFLCTDYDTYSIAPPGTCLKVTNTETQWVESLSALIEDPSLRAQLVEKARDWVLANGTAGDHILPRIQFYQDVIARRKTLADNSKHELGREATLHQE